MSNSAEHKKLKIGISLGDFNGIGPELILKCFQDARFRDLCVPIVYGSSRVLNIYRKILNINKFNYFVVSKVAQAHHNKLNLVECIPQGERVDIGQATEAGGKGAYLALQRMIQDAMHEELDVMVTLPVDKAMIQKEDEHFVGHTEMLTHAFGADESLMLMVADKLRVGVVTNHLPLRNVPQNISVEGIIRKAEIFHRSLQIDFNIPRPLLAILGLNPHAGDHGLIGSEDQEIVAAAIDQLKSKGMLVEGPYPADGFFGALSYRRFDGVLAMYHDQGLIPFKLIAGYNGVNFTAGLPFVRTSPDHGVAYNIAGKNLAEAESLRQSIYLAMDVFRNRKQNLELEAQALPPLDDLKHALEREDDVVDELPPEPEPET